jgi:hypothetical protein
MTSDSWPRGQMSLQTAQPNLPDKVLFRRTSVKATRAIKEFVLTD